MLRLLPREEPFFDYFDKAAANGNQAARALAHLLDNFVRVEDQVEAITELEHRGDFITHEIAERLNKTFLTPIERDDIHALASAMDNVVDRIEAAADALLLYQVEQPTEEARELAHILVDSTERLREAITQLRNPKQYAQVRTSVVEVNRLENEADKVARRAIAKLVAHRDQLFELIRWRDIYEQLERATDDCEDVADVLESIVLKHA
ncbi:MAG: DUF47 domain-containing protein [Chloroflexi bacterium]|nr:DUF47 domain-containing protein [Chloroflexota bacterium]